MSIRGFFKALLGTGSGHPGPKHSGDDLAEEIRDAIGPVGGGASGRLSGGAVYRHLEDRER